MLFSITCLTYKRPELLEEAVYSVLQQTCIDWELLIINDWVDQTIYFDHPQVRIFNLKTKFRSIADKRNFGIENSIGDLIFQLDDDDFLLPSYLSNLKNVIGNADYLFAQRPILYFNDPKKICLSPVPQVNTTIYKRLPITQQFRYEDSDTDEGITLNPYFQRIEKNYQGLQRMLQLHPNQCGHVWRQDISKNRKYSLSELLTKNISETEQSNLLTSIDSPCGDITLIPKWNEDYTEIIKKNMRLIDPMPFYKKIDGGSEMFQLAKDISNIYKKEGTEGLKKLQSTIPERPIDEWRDVKPTWENAVKFLDTVKSRGIFSTILDVAGINKTIGERVSEEILNQRKLSCFGDRTKNIASCARLKYIESKGYFCGGCGCGQKDIARLDSDSNDEYTKLHYPQLECPLKRRGFSNYEIVVPSNEIPLSIIIPVLNDNEELNLTIKSIYETTPDNVEIIVIDDASDIPATVLDKRVKLFRFNERRGAGQARHFGAINATSKRLLFIDSHMRFTSDWFDNAMIRMKTTPQTLWCGACLGLDSKNMDINYPVGVYTGADLVLHKKEVIFDGVWRPDISDKDDYEISCVMGACYFLHKDWYFYIKGLEHTKMWGSEEPILSIKTWLAGGDVRLMKSVRLGHKFRDVSPYSTPVSAINYNKLAYMHILFPKEIYQKLKEKFGNNGDVDAAMKLVEENEENLNKEKQYFQSIMKHDIYWLCQKFNIEIP